MNRRDHIPSFHFSRLTFREENAHVAQLAEHVLGKDEVTRSIRVVGSRWDVIGDERRVMGQEPKRVAVHSASLRTCLASRL